jgi:hypothetical protein
MTSNFGGEMEEKVLEIDLKDEDKVVRVGSFQHLEIEIPEKTNAANEEAKQATHSLIKFETEGVIGTK